jgi:3'(2'), 5'-bisphosphate nucleotidase
VTDRDHELAHRVAEEAGDLLLELRGSVTGAEADAASHSLLVDRLTTGTDGDAILSEEGSKTDTSAAKLVWIVDPLDGTREYCEEGRSDWAVHVALWEDGALVAGAVALPAQREVVSTRTPLPPCGTQATPSRPLRVIASRSRMPDVARVVAEALDAELVQLGSACAKTIAVARGDADAYVHAGGQYEWDSAAPAVVARTCGLHVSRLDGSALGYNQVDPWLPDFLVCRPELASRVLEAAAPALS